jgi:hypothetical protein
LLSYYGPDIPVELPSAQRSEFLKSIYNFDCDCALCSAPISKKHISDGRRVRISHIRELLKDPRTAYEDVINLSREILHLVEEENMGFKLREYFQDLMKAHFRHGDLETAIHYARAALKDEDAFESEEVEFKAVLQSNLQALEKRLRVLRELQ